MGLGMYLRWQHIQWKGLPIIPAPKVGGRSQVQGHPQLHGKLKVCLGFRRLYTVGRDGDTTSQTARQVKAAHCTSLWHMSDPQRVRWREKTNVSELHMHCPLPNKNNIFLKRKCVGQTSNNSPHKAVIWKEESPTEKRLHFSLACGQSRAFFSFDCGWQGRTWLPWVSDPRAVRKDTEQATESESVTGVPTISASVPASRPFIMEWNKLFPLQVADHSIL